MHIVVVGSVNMDLAVRSERFPEAGETILGGQLEYQPGGKGANQAVAAARLAGPETKVSFIGCTGRDSFGETLRAGLQRDGLALGGMCEDATAASGVALILLDRTAQNRIVVAPGANRRLTPDHLRRVWPGLGRVEIVVLSLEIPMETVLEAARLGQASQATVILNPAPAPAAGLPAELWGLINLLVPNENEAAALCPAAAGQPEDEGAMARALLGCGVRTVVMTLGAQGALILEQGSSPERIAAEPVTPVDTVAAGDCFVGALAARLAERSPLVEAVRYANRAAALAVTRRGAQHSIPHRRELA